LIDVQQLVPNAVIEAGFSVNVVKSKKKTCTKFDTRYEIIAPDIRAQE